MTEKEYAADCIAFLRELAERMRREGKFEMHMGDADKLEEIAASLQIDILEDSHGTEAVR